MTRTVSLTQPQRNDLLSVILKKASGESAEKTPLSEHEVKELLKKSGLTVPAGVYIPKGKTAAARGLHYPLAAKVSSRAVASKSDIGGVVLNITDHKSLKGALSKLMAIKLADGVLVEEMAPPGGVEVIIGGIIDRQFGPVVMFGLGGIFVELFRDVAFGLAPMNENDALRLAKQVKGYKLLEGYRGSRAVDIKALLKSMVIVSSLMATGMIDEMDLNPVALYPDGAIILDAKMSLRADESSLVKTGNKRSS